ncbi:hypothetical protein [Desulfotalea psychrophila]|uniref:hypothetical protein n=1 Tax=Desulfotalea psychrophila TaxID=84980 RepID=UPI0003091EC9|nr:hypothetical protein [Desulfotalea psychrophila]
MTLKKNRLREKALASLDAALEKLEQDFSGSLSLRFDLCQGGLRRVGVSLSHEHKVEELKDG